MAVAFAFIIWFLGFSVVFENIVIPILDQTHAGIWGTLVGMGFAICLPLLLLQAFIWIMEQSWSNGSSFTPPDEYADRVKRMNAERLAEINSHRIRPQTATEPVVNEPVLPPELPPVSTNDTETLGGRFIRKGVVNFKQVVAKISGYKFSKSYMALLIIIMLMLPTFAIISVVKDKHTNEMIEQMDKKPNPIIMT